MAETFACPNFWDWY